MSTPLLMTAVGALLVFLGTAWRRPAAGRAAWTVGAGLAAMLVAITLAAPALKSGATARPITAVGKVAQKTAIGTVVLQRKGQQRQVRQLRLERPVSGGLPALLALAFAGLIALGLRRKRGGAAGVAGGAVCAVVVFALAGGTGSGEAGMTEFLAPFDRGQLISMTPPTGEWTFAAPGLPALGVVLALGVLAVFVQFLKPGERLGTGLAVVGATLAAGAVALQISALGGLYWTGAQSAVWAVAVVLIIATQDRSGWRPATLSALAAAVAGLAFI